MPSFRTVLPRSTPVGAAVAVGYGGGEAFTGPGTGRDGVTVLLFAVTLLVVGFAVDAVAGDRDR
ncbi:hypothetical protein ACFV0T_39195 [Streptomyces sp. NPDC059582]|uniref:hypothetical protein n=1 Tax=Streptomyces sp. NPDC059582 TaxID=3346875 RepID=UPI0036C9493B